MGHAVSLCFVLAHAAVPMALWRGEPAIAAEMTKLLLASSKEHSFLIWHEFGRAYQAVLELDSNNAQLGSVPPAMGALLLETLATLNENLADDEILARAKAGLPAGARPSYFALVENGYFGRARKIGREPRDCYRDHSTWRDSRERCRGNFDPQSAFPNCGRIKIAGTWHSACLHPYETVSLKGLPPRILSARRCSLEGWARRYDLRALARRDAVATSSGSLAQSIIVAIVWGLLLQCTSPAWHV